MIWKCLGRWSTGKRSLEELSDYVVFEFFWMSQILLMNLYMMRKNNPVCTADRCMWLSAGLAWSLCLFSSRDLWQLPKQWLPFSKWPGGKLLRLCSPLGSPWYTLCHPNNSTHNCTNHDCRTHNHTSYLQSWCLWNTNQQVRPIRGALFPFDHLPLRRTFYAV